MRYEIVKTKNAVNKKGSHVTTNENPRKEVNLWL